MKSVEAQAFWDSIMMGRTAQQFVNQMLVIKAIAESQKVNRTLDFELS